MLTGDKEKAFLEESLPVPPVCKACKWYNLCRNGCKRERAPETGVNRWCSVHTKFFEYAYPRMQEMANQLKKH